MATTAPQFLRAHSDETEDPMTAKRWLTVAETAERFNLHRNTVEVHLRAGTFPCRAQKFGRVWRIDADDVDRVLLDLEPVSDDEL